MKYLSLFLICCLVFTCQRSTPTSIQYVHETAVSTFKVNKEELSCHCHSQGVAWSMRSHQMVVTCEGKDGFSYLLLFPDYKKNNSHEAIDVVRTDANQGFAHPSSIQIIDDVFPVALAKGKNEGAQILFYEITPSKLLKLEDQELAYPKHIGALAYAKINNEYYLVGLGWDAKDFAIWKSKEAHQNFKLIKEGVLNEIATGSLAAYNSVWLGMVNGEVTLLASAGNYLNKKKNYLDFFSFDLENLTLKKTYRLPVKGITKGTTKSLFFEGFTIRSIEANGFSIISIPQDFNLKKEGSILKYLYEGKVIFN